MGKKKSGSSGPRERTRLNPLTGQVEKVSGTKAGKNRTRESFGSALRTHDLRPLPSKKKQKPIFDNDED